MTKLTPWEYLYICVLESDTQQFELDNWLDHENFSLYMQYRISKL